MKHHIVRIFAIAALIFGFTFVKSIAAQDQQQQEQEPQPHQRGPSTPEERMRAVKIAHDLESDPLAKDAGEQRAWVYQWITDIPDITVNVCLDYFGKMPNPPHGHSTEIAKQMIISMAAFMIEHPAETKNEQAISLAGLLGSIKAYQAILKQEPDSRWAQMDKLVQTRDEGKLDDFVADTRRKCAQEDEQPDPDTMRAQVIFPR